MAEGFILYFLVTAEFPSVAPVATMCDSDRPLPVIKRVSVTTELIKAGGGGPGGHRPASNWLGRKLVMKDY